MSLATLLLLADGRFPSGGHAHSGGLESAVQAGRVHDIPSLEGFLLGRLHTSGMVGAALAAAVCAGADPAAADVAADVRTPAPPLRQVSRSQGRALIRAGRAIWPSPRLDELAAARPDGPHQPVAFGLLAAVAGVPPDQAALASAHGSISGPASAAIRMLGLDPYAVHAVLARLGSACEQVAREAATAAGKPLRELPMASAPLLDISAADHATWEVRLFAS
ncbi:urease accessory protein UreF [Flindersiella endophytica]